MLAYVVTGAFVGFLAGLLGIGGGMTLVPVLAAMFSAQHFAPDHTVHLALGTGMASIMFTSSASVRTHHRLGGVDWSLVRRMWPAMVTGTLLATALGLRPSRIWVAPAYTIAAKDNASARCGTQPDSAVASSVPVTIAGPMRRTSDQSTPPRRWCVRTLALEVNITDAMPVPRAR